MNGRLSTAAADSNFDTSTLREPRRSQPATFRPVTDTDRTSSKFHNRLRSIPDLGLFTSLKGALELKAMRVPTLSDLSSLWACEDDCLSPSRLLLSVLNPCCYGTWANGRCSFPVPSHFWRVDQGYASSTISTIRSSVFLGVGVHPCAHPPPPPFFTPPVPSLVSSRLVSSHGGLRGAFLTHE